LFVIHHSIYVQLLLIVYHTYLYKHNCTNIIQMYEDMGRKSGNFSPICRKYTGKKFHLLTSELLHWDTHEIKK
jgi:hypothetical protein